MTTRHGRFDKDYYAVLGVPPEAREDEIRRAYRRLALQWHPDRNPGKAEAAERFKEISEAYGVLIDRSKRDLYDQARRTGEPGDFRFSREDILRDLFSNPGACGVFEELSREFERMGMRVDRHHFRRTLFGGRTVVTGGIFIISPLTPLLGIFRLAGAALRGRRSEAAVGPRPNPMLRAAGMALAGMNALGRRLFGSEAGPGRALSGGDVVQALPIEPMEAATGGHRRITIRTNGKSEDLLVSIPRGVSAGTKLRLKGKGRPDTAGVRGDLYLAIEIIE